MSTRFLKLYMLLSILFLSLIVVVVGAWASFEKRKIALNPLNLFCLGFLFYYLFPVVFSEFRIFEDLPPLSLWYRVYDEPTDASKWLYIVCAWFYFFSFILGYLIGRKIYIPTIRGFTTNNFDSRLLYIFLFPVALLATMFAYWMKDELFVGYQGNIFNDFSWRGSFAAVCLILFGIAIIKLSALGSSLNKRLFWKTVLFHPTFMVYWIFAVLNLTMGGRLYFLASILSLVVFYTRYIAGVKLGSALLFIIIMFGFISLAGVLRSGGLPSFIALGENFALEALFTSLPIFPLLSGNSLNVIDFPIFLLSDFINLVPTVLLPDKSDLIITPGQAGHIIYNPMGALHQFVSVTTNFGLLGSVMFFLFFGAFFGVLFKYSDRSYVKVWYVISCGFIATSFFRDPFFVVIIKNWFQYSLLIPTLIMFMTHCLSYIVKKKR